ncbi:MAG TPA: hypothetical protein G4N94_05020 [Caldilineae bacterium]|nr:hypothetical protein [Caldilineae bacterium]
MNLFAPGKDIIVRPKTLDRWQGRRELSARTPRRHGRLTKPLTAVGILGGLALGAAATVIVAGGLLVVGIGILAVGVLALGRLWLKAQRSGVWLHVLVDNDDVVISLVFPLPISLVCRGLQLVPATDDAVEMARMILEDPELLDTLHTDAIEITVDDGADHIEVVVGPRRKRWRAFQFRPIRAISKTQFSPITEEINHV